MGNINLELRKLTEKWRMAGQKARVVAMEITNLTARGHMVGLSDGLDVAAADVDTLLDDHTPGIDPTTTVQ